MSRRFGEECLEGEEEGKEEEGEGEEVVVVSVG